MANIRGFEMGEVKNDDWHNPKPCPFVVKDKGCKQYLLRPKDPCKTFQCEWIADPTFPEEFKPNLVNSITVRKVTNTGLPYMYLTDAGSKLDSKVLSFHFQHALANRINLVWRIEGVTTFIGSPEFMQYAHDRMSQKLEL